MSKKTNAMRQLDQLKVSYQVLEYDIKDGLIDGVSVATKVGEDPKNVYKTLVTTGGKNYYVAIIPVVATLNLKSFAKCVGEKKLEMIAVKDIIKITGYQRGGCSPIGMKKHYTTVIDHSVNEIENIVFSGGKKGIQIKMNADEFVSSMKPTVDSII